MVLAVLGLGLYSCTTQKKSGSMDLPQEWMHSTTIYEINTRQYSQEGTFKEVEKELPRLKAMGVETIWFMPITPIAQEKKKGSLGSPYAAYDYTSVNPEFGTLDDFKSLVKEAHRLGLKVIIDWVANHTGWDHVWTKSNPDFYLKEEDGSFHIASGMDDIIELDFSNSKLREAMIDAMKYWVTETDIDGFRCDLASWVEVDFWQQARPEVEKIKPLFWLGEFDELETPEYGKVFDASYSWSWMHKTRDYYNGKVSLEDLKSLLYKYSDIGDNSMRAWFTTNHDENSWNGTEYEKYGVLAKPLAVFSATWNGVPLIYSGQELPNTKRLEFFEKDPIKWNSHYGLADFYKTLFNLKSKNAALRGGDPKVKTYMLKTNQDDKVLAYVRKNGQDEVVVLLNLSKEDVSFVIDTTELQGKFKNIFSKESHNFDQNKEYSLKVGGYAVLKK